LQTSLSNCNSLFSSPSTTLNILLCLFLHHNGKSIWAEDPKLNQLCWTMHIPRDISKVCQGKNIVPSQRTQLIVLCCHLKGPSAWKAERICDTYEVLPHLLVSCQLCITYYLTHPQLLITLN
jgi:hypothetical protein